MSTCISSHGEYGSHIVVDFACTRCGVFDEDELLEQYQRAKRQLDRLAVGLTIRGYPSTQDPVSDALGALDAIIQARDEARAKAHESARRRAGDPYVEQLGHAFITTLTELPTDSTLALISYISGGHIKNQDGSVPLEDD